MGSKGTKKRLKKWTLEEDDPLIKDDVKKRIRNGWGKVGFEIEERVWEEIREKVEEK